jgi:AcrR family transcriptional regulator
MQSAVQRSTPAQTRQRIIDAAGRVFAQQGLAGATTRVIAEEAGVNEVTLFRHFQTKDRLLAEVVGQNFGPTATPDSATPALVSTPDLHADLLELGRRYQELLQTNLPLVRTMIGEIQHRHRDQEHQVFTGIFRPVKAALLARIAAAQAKGTLRRDVRPDILSDLFAGMIFTGVLRRAAPELKLDYPASDYLEAAVDLVMRGAGSGTSRRE